MPDTETRALRRAVVLLLTISVARWVHATVAGRGSPPPENQMVEEAARHAARTRTALKEEEARTRPLAEGETIDPNRASTEELDRLPGVGPSKARAIVTARENGTVFLGPGDLATVRGFGPAVIERILPHLVFPAAAARARPPPADRPRVRALSPSPVDVNRAGLDELVRLPRIGPVTAERILAARRERPFSSVEDLSRVPGIGPATVEALRGLVTVGPRRR